MTGKRIFERRSSARHWLCATSCLALLVGAPGIAHAQQASADQNPETTPQAEANELQEIIVTAQRRSENIQDVPISITPFSNEEITRRGVADLRELEFAIPNVQFEGTQQSSNANISIRGITGGNFGGSAGFETGLAVYLDGVYVGSTAAFDQNLEDIERLEVLRGPQGTLYGRNALAGALNYVTRKPDTNEVRARANLEVGNYDHVRGAASLSLPLVTDKVAIKGAFYGGRRDGYVRNTFNGDDLDDDEFYGGRLQLLATPTENLDVLLSADGFWQDRKAFFVGELEDDVPGAVPGNRSQALDVTPVDKREFKGVNLNLDYRIGDFTLTSITAWRSADADQVIDNDVSPLSLITSRVSDRQEQFSQELRLTSPRGRRLEVIAGAFYFSQDSDQDAIFALGRPFFDLFGLGALVPNGDQAANFVEIDTESYALFAQADYHVTDALTLTLGGRYSKDKKTLDRFVQDVSPILSAALGFPAIADASDEIDEEDFSPLAIVEYKWTPDIITYAKVATAYKSGGFNTRLIPSFANISFGAESITTYELGFKSTFFDRRLRFNAAAFYSDYENLQRLQFDVETNVSAFTNDAQAEVKGFEFDVTAQPITGLTLSGGLGYADAKYTSFPGGAFLGGEPIDLEGERLSGVPSWTGNASAQYAVSIGFADLVLRGDYFYRSGIEFESGLFNDGEAVRSSSLHRVNARIGLVDPDERWELFLWADNLFDEDDVLTRGSTLFFDQPVVTYRPPRTYGLQASLRF